MVCDNEVYQSKVESVNAALLELCTTSEVNFINNDPTFRLQDNSINDGYLTLDGLHLTKKGTERLLKNLKIDTSGPDLTIDNRHRSQRNSSIRNASIWNQYDSKVQKEPVVAQFPKTFSYYTQSQLQNSKTNTDKLSKDWPKLPSNQKTFSERPTEAWSNWSLVKFHVHPKSDSSILQQQTTYQCYI